MTIPEPARTCPRCASADSTRRAADVAAAQAGTPLARQLGAPRSPGAGGELGCATLLFSAMIGLSVALIASAIAHFTSSQGPGPLPLGLRDSSVYTGIVVFLFVFVGVFAVFVWRQARQDARLKLAVMHWRRAQQRWEQLWYCERCNGVFIPGHAELTPVEQAQALLYAVEPRAQPTPQQS